MSKEAFGGLWLTKLLSVRPSSTFWAASFPSSPSVACYVFQLHIDDWMVLDVITHPLALKVLRIVGIKWWWWSWQVLLIESRTWKNMIEDYYYLFPFFFFVWKLIPRCLNSRRSLEVVRHQKSIWFYRRFPKIKWREESGKLIKQFEIFDSKHRRRHD